MTKKNEIANLNHRTSRKIKSDAVIYRAVSVLTSEIRRVTALEEAVMARKSVLAW